MQFKNDSHHYGLIAIAFHWIIALLICIMLGVGLYMTSLPEGPTMFKLINIHKACGILILALTLLRILWRFINPVPTLVDLPAWERLSARTVHLLLYGLMLAMPLSGWLMSSAGGYPISFFGWFTVPPLWYKDPAVAHLWSTTHTWLAYSLIGLIALHTLAALKHHYVDKDLILKRMMHS